MTTKTCCRQIAAIFAVTTCLTICAGSSYASQSNSGKSIAEINSLLQAHNPAAAIRLATTALEKDPRNAYILLQRGAAYSSLKKRELALADLSASISLHPTAEAYIERMTVHRELENPQKALRDAEDAVKISPRAFFILTVAELQMDVGEVDRSMTTARRGLTMLKTEQPPQRNFVEMSLYQTLAKGYLAKNDPGKGLEYINKALALLPNWTTASKSHNKQLMKKALGTVHSWIFIRANAYTKLRKNSEAISDYELICDMLPNNFTYKKTLIRAYQRANENQKALLLVNKFLKDDDLSYWYYRRSEIYKKFGKEDLAKRDYDRAHQS